MEIIKLIAYILCFLYFAYKTYASGAVYFKENLKDIQKAIPSIKNKTIYLIGIFEHIFYLILINLLYFIK